jgi:hypothetical protein
MLSTPNHDKKYKNPYVNKPKQRHYLSKASKGLQTRNEASEDEHVDI